MGTQEPSGSKSDTICFQEGSDGMDDQQMKAIICRNLKMLFDSRPGSRADFARRHYMSQSTVTKWTQGIAGDISLCNAWQAALSE